MDVLIFTLGDCEHCKDLKKRLNVIKIPFKEMDINIIYLSNNGS